MSRHEKSRNPGCQFFGRDCQDPSSLSTPVGVQQELFRTAQLGSGRHLGDVGALDVVALEEVEAGAQGALRLVLHDARELQQQLAHVVGAGDARLLPQELQLGLDGGQRQVEQLRAGARHARDLRL